MHTIKSRIITIISFDILYFIVITYNTKLSD